MNVKLKYAGFAAAGVVATLVAGGVAMATISGPWGRGPMGPFGRADLNNDGTITKAEWMQAADARFVALDANKDGKLVEAELPKPPHRPHHGHGGPDGHRDFDGRDGDREMGPPSAQPSAGSAPVPVTPAAGNATAPATK